ncbi:HepT-like ribonuclease domain-containing protein [Elioraea sp.]|jgi:uncharacterized protein with HEPN domain|uniref:HepT-like ribonuclease domain-containing protein n=1 Tax=Elioraea sp. TaxID=2185103 RepID=UPI003F6E9B13
MRADPRGLLWDAHDAAETVAVFIRGHTLAEYRADRMLRSAVERQCEVVGEALNRLAKVAPDLAARVPGLAQAVAFRNLLIHGYAVVDDAVVWRTVQQDLPVLSRDLAALLAETGPQG